MTGTPPTVTLTTLFVPNPTCYTPGHLSQINDPASCYTSQGTVTCQRATHGPGHERKETSGTGCFPDQLQTALTECPQGHTSAAHTYHIYSRLETKSAAATFSGGTDHPVIVTLAQIPALGDLSLEEGAAVTVGLEYASRLTDSAEEVTAAWDYENGVLVAHPQQIRKYAHGNVTYWGQYYYDNRFGPSDLPASRTGAAAMATATATAAEGLVAGTDEKDGDSSNALATSPEAVPSSSSTSAGHQGLKLSGMLCASVMGLGLFLSGSGLW
ncbi:hypothetical protein QBC32DRAFT_316629 [Pseudoneurospora amorphoporcata]|uniref:Uncharacterized protein n=1 Tax=Pseudoneurospora amorphoporcata TaxID=241081 RepID=A0AAN6NPI7_9PEZI|nr:hypothetical protein QBC32DRAFT_316629 [Pseudoneurospora amorphoporcata]